MTICGDVPSSDGGKERGKGEEARSEPRGQAWGFPLRGGWGRLGGARPFGERRHGAHRFLNSALVYKEVLYLQYNHFPLKLLKLPFYREVKSGLKDATSLAQAHEERAQMRRKVVMFLVPALTRRVVPPVLVVSGAEGGGGGWRALDDAVGAPSACRAPCVSIQVLCGKHLWLEPSVKPMPGHYFGSLN